MMMVSQRRGRNPGLVVLLVAFGLLGIVCFQIVKERRASDALLQEMASENSKARKDLEEANEVADDLRQTILRLRLENGKLLAEKENLHKQLMELEHEKSSSENEKQELLESFQAKKEELDILKQQLVHQRQDEAEAASLKVKVDSLRKDLETTSENQIENAPKLTAESNGEKKTEDQYLIARQSNSTEQETSGAENSSDDELHEKHSSVRSDEQEQIIEEKGQRQGFKGDVLMESRASESDGQVDENEIFGSVHMNKLDKDAGEGREELSDSIEETNDRKDEVNETEFLKEKEASNDFLNEDEISDQVEAHLESLKTKLDHELDEDGH